MRQVILDMRLHGNRPRRQGASWVGVGRTKKVACECLQMGQISRASPTQETQAASQPLFQQGKGRQARVRAQSHVLLKTRAQAISTAVRRRYRCHWALAVPIAALHPSNACVAANELLPVRPDSTDSHRLVPKSPSPSNPTRQHPTRRPSLSHFALRASLRGLDTPLRPATCTPYYPPSPTLPQPKRLTTVAAMDGPRRQHHHHHSFLLPS